MLVSVRLSHLSSAPLVFILESFFLNINNFNRQLSDTSSSASITTNQHHRVSFVPTDRPFISLFTSTRLLDSYSEITHIAIQAIVMEGKRSSAPQLDTKLSFPGRSSRDNMADRHQAQPHGAASSSRTWREGLRDFLTAQRRNDSIGKPYLLVHPTTDSC